MLKTVTIRTAILACTCALSISAHAIADSPKQVSVPAGDLALALEQLAKQSGVEFVYSTEELKGLRTNGVQGELTAEKAVTKLLEGTQLILTRHESGALLIAPPHGSGASRTAVEKTGATRLAQGESDSSSQGERSESRSSATDSPSPVFAGAEKNRIVLEEIVVTGTNIRGVYPSSSPVEIYTAEDIARTGATTTEQFIAKLPQNLGTRTQFAVAATATPNREGVTTVDLRGLGVGSTLVLLNGRRLALASSGQGADVSLIPMSAIERVEVLTDGASAIYGSDAIGGVVNFVLRKDFSGAQTSLGYGGVTSGELRQSNFTQTFGGQWNSGQVLVSYDYFDATALERTDRDYAAAAGPGTLTPDTRRHSGLATFSQNVGERLNVSGDFALARRDVKNVNSFLNEPNPLQNTNSRYSSETRQYFGNLGADLRISETLHGELLASYSDIDVDSLDVRRNLSSGALLTTRLDTAYSALDLTAKLDGTLFALPAGIVRFSFGGGYLDEQYLGVQANGGASTRDLGRATTYVFGEIFAPLVEGGQGIPLVHRLEVSFAARYTNYDDTSSPALSRDFGDSTSPKVGLLWAPTPALSLRATYGESFRAPSLTEMDPTGSINALQPITILGVSSTLLRVFGPSSQLDAETADSFTLGLDYRSQALPGLRLGTTYFNIDYKDRIARGDTTGGLAPLANPAAWPDVLFRASSAPPIEELLTSTRNIANLTAVNLTDPHAAALQLAALPEFWVYDGRYRNLSLSKLDGLDLSASYDFATTWGEVNLGAHLTRILDYRQQVSINAPVLTVVDTVLQPVDLRGRVYAGLKRGGLETTVNVNYVDAYSNPYAIGGPQGVASWTTVDCSVSYVFGRRTHHLLDGVRVSLSVQNLLDEDPPRIEDSGRFGQTVRNPIGFDPANANPLNRFVMLSLSKTW